MEIMRGKLTEADFTLILKLLEQLWTEKDYTVDYVRRMYVQDLQTNRRQYFTARDSGKIVGLCIMFTQPDMVYKKVAIIDDLVVDENYRNKGLGKQLLQAAEDYARNQKCYRLELHSNMKRLDAHRFYEANGFEKTSYYFKKKLLSISANRYG